MDCSAWMRAMRHTRCLSAGFRWYPTMPAGDCQKTVGKKSGTVADRMASQGLDDRGAHSRKKGHPLKVTLAERTLALDAHSLAPHASAGVPRTHTCPGRKCRGVPGSAGECRCPAHFAGLPFFLPGFRVNPRVRPYEIRPGEIGDGDDAVNVIGHDHKRLGLHRGKLFCQPIPPRVHHRSDWRGIDQALAVLTDDGYKGCAGWAWSYPRSRIDRRWCLSRSVGISSLPAERVPAVLQPGRRTLQRTQPSQRQGAAFAQHGVDPRLQALVRDRLHHGS